MRAAMLAAVPIVLLGAPPAKSHEPLSNGSGGCSPPLALHLANRPLFEALCASTGFDLMDPALCAPTSFNSTLDLLTQTFLVPPDQLEEIPTIASGLTNVLAGGNELAALVASTLARVPVPTVPLHADPCDALLSDGLGGCAGAAHAPHLAFVGSGLTLNQVLSDEQEGFVGCGPFFASNCESTGIDLFAAMPVALTQSWVGFDGTCIQSSGFEDWHLANGEPQAGTIGFAGEALPSQPGMRSPFLADGLTPNPDHDVGQDGSIDGLVIPAAFGASAGQQFASEMAALSFNLQLLLVVLSSTQGSPERDQLDPSHPYALYDPEDPSTSNDQGRCSFLQPQHCRARRILFVPEPDAALGAAVALAALGGLGTRRRRRRASPRAARSPAAEV